MATQAEIRNKALEYLGAIASGDTPDSGDQTFVDDAYDSLYQELRSRHLVDWGSAADIPVWAENHIVTILSSRIAPAYGLPANPHMEELAFARMAKALADDYTYQPIRADFY